MYSVGSENYGHLKCIGTLMVLMQSAEVDLNWSWLLAEATEAGSEF